MLAAILSAFLGGLILNIMPCVFPVLSLKAIGLVRHGGSAHHARLEGVAFFLGVMAALLTLAGTLIVIRASGTAIGWGFQLQSPIVIGALVLVMLGAALNLAGLFEVGLSVQGIGHSLVAKPGLLGAGLTGVLAIVVATPCAAPFMAGAIGYALVQPPIIALTIFAALGIGFAAPFTLLAFVPALARSLPKPGPWMDTVKRVLAFPMFGAAAWLVWVLNQQAGQTGLAIILAASIAFGFAAWIYGMAQQRRMSGLSFGVLYGLAGTVMAGVIAATITLQGQTIQNPLAGQTASAHASGKPQTWSPDRVATLRAQGAPILVNFTASWCITCQVNDKVALSTAVVKQALLETGTTYMIADSTNYDPLIEKALAENGRGGLPLYIYYPANGGRPILLPQILTPTKVVDTLKRGGNKPA